MKHEMNLTIKEKRIKRWKTRTGRGWECNHAYWGGTKSHQLKI